MKAFVTTTLIVAPLAAALAQVPAGSSIFDKAINRPGIGWSIYGANQTAKQVPAAEVPGGAAVRVEVRRAGANPWDVGGAYPTVKPIAAGDTLLVMLYLRAPDTKEGDSAPVPIGASEADAPYTPIADQTVKVGPVWKRYFAAGVSSKGFAAGKARIAIQLGGAKQVVEVGPAFLFDMGPGYDMAKLPHN
ncbi:MAG: hypothetical protein M3N23_06245 [Pseudomonadota bacterium]|nr:hypothetical protein [Pseudomonadota bacterium]